jgi:hypothetical protein
VGHSSVFGQRSNECLKAAIANGKIPDVESLEISIASKCIYELSEPFGIPVDVCMAHNGTLGIIIIKP